MAERFVDTQLNNPELNLQKEIELAKADRDRWLFLAGFTGVAAIIDRVPKSLIEVVADINDQGEFNWQRAAAVAATTGLISILCEMARQDHSKLKDLKRQERIRQAYRAL